MTKKEIAQAEAVKTLKEWGIKDGTTIYAKVVRVSSSGMSRHVRLYANIKGEVVDISYHAAKALEWGYAGDRYNEGIRVSGCGMDMLFHTVYSLSYAMGYGALDQTHSKEDRNINKEGYYGLKYRQL